MTDNSSAQIVRVVSIMASLHNQFGLESAGTARSSPEQKPEFLLRKPVSTDGTAVNRLIAQCPPLDPNSVYCNVLQCSHFADTSVLVETGGEVIAFMSGYVKPDDVPTLFVWQVAVAENWRGHGLAGRMLEALTLRPELKDIAFVETSVTPATAARRAGQGHRGEDRDQRSGPVRDRLGSALAPVRGATAQGRPGDSGTSRDSQGSGRGTYRLAGQ